MARVYRDQPLTQEFLTGHQDRGWASKTGSSNHPSSSDEQPLAPYPPAGMGYGAPPERRRDNGYASRATSYGSHAQAGGGSQGYESGFQSDVSGRDAPPHFEREGRQRGGGAWGGRERKPEEEQRDSGFKDLGGGEGRMDEVGNVPGGAENEKEEEVDHAKMADMWGSSPVLEPKKLPPPRPTKQPPRNVDSYRTPQDQTQNQNQNQHQNSFNPPSLAPEDHQTPRPPRAYPPALSQEEHDHSTSESWGRGPGSSGVARDEKVAMVEDWVGGGQAQGPATGARGEQENDEQNRQQGEDRKGHQRTESQRYREESEAWGSAPAPANVPARAVSPAPPLARADEHTSPRPRAGEELPRQEPYRGRQDDSGGWGRGPASMVGRQDEGRREGGYFEGSVNHEVDNPRRVEETRITQADGWGSASVKAGSDAPTNLGRPENTNGRSWDHQSNGPARSQPPPSKAVRSETLSRGQARSNHSGQAGGWGNNDSGRYENRERLNGGYQDRQGPPPQEAGWNRRGGNDGGPGFGDGNRFGPELARDDRSNRGDGSSQQSWNHQGRERDGGYPSRDQEQKLSNPVIQRDWGSGGNNAVSPSQRQEPPQDQTGGGQGPSPGRWDQSGGREQRDEYGSVRQELNGGGPPGGYGQPRSPFPQYGQSPSGDKRQDERSCGPYSSGLRGWSEQENHRSQNPQDGGRWGHDLASAHGEGHPPSKQEDSNRRPTVDKPEVKAQEDDWVGGRKNVPQASLRTDPVEVRDLVKSRSDDWGRGEEPSQPRHATKAAAGDWGAGPQSAPTALKEATQSQGDWSAAPIRANTTVEKNLDHPLPAANTSAAGDWSTGPAATARPPLKSSPGPHQVVLAQETLAASIADDWGGGPPQVTKPPKAPTSPNVQPAPIRPRGPAYERPGKPSFPPGSPQTAQSPSQTARSPSAAQYPERRYQSLPEVLEECAIDQKSWELPTSGKRPVDAKPSTEPPSETGATMVASNSTSTISEAAQAEFKAASVADWTSPVLETHHGEDWNNRFGTSTGVRGPRLHPEHSAQLVASPSRQQGVGQLGHSSPNSNAQTGSRRDDRSGDNASTTGMSPAAQQQRNWGRLDEGRGEVSNNLRQATSPAGSSNSRPLWNNFPLNPTRPLRNGPTCSCGSFDHLRWSCPIYPKIYRDEAKRDSSPAYPCRFCVLRGVTSGEEMHFESLCMHNTNYSSNAREVLMRSQQFASPSDQGNMPRRDDAGGNSSTAAGPLAASAPNSRLQPPSNDAERTVVDVGVLPGIDKSPSNSNLTVKPRGSVASNASHERRAREAKMIDEYRQKANDTPEMSDSPDQSHSPQDQAKHLDIGTWAREAAKVADPPKETHPHFSHVPSAVAQNLSLGNALDKPDAPVPEYLAARNALHVNLPSSAPDHLIQEDSASFSVRGSSGNPPNEGRRKRSASRTETLTSDVPPVNPVTAEDLRSEIQDMNFGSSSVAKNLPKFANTKDHLVSLLNPGGKKQTFSHTVGADEPAVSTGMESTAHMAKELSPDDRQQRSNAPSPVSPSIGSQSIAVPGPGDLSHARAPSPALSIQPQSNILVRFNHSDETLSSLLPLVQSRALEAKLGTEIEKLRAENHRLQAQSTHATTSAQVIVERYNDSIREIEVQKAEIMKMTNEAYKWHAEAMVLRNQVEMATSQNHQRLQEIEGFKAEVTKVKEQNQDLTKEKYALESELHLVKAKSLSAQNITSSIDILTHKLGFGTGTDPREKFLQEQRGNPLEGPLGDTPQDQLKKHLALKVAAAESEKEQAVKKADALQEALDEEVKKNEVLTEENAFLRDLMYRRYPLRRASSIEPDGDASAETASEKGLTKTLSEMQATAIVKPNSDQSSKPAEPERLPTGRPHRSSESSPHADSRQGLSLNSDRKLSPYGAAQLAARVAPVAPVDAEKTGFKFSSGTRVVSPNSASNPVPAGTYLSTGSRVLSS